VTSIIVTGGLGFVGRYLVRRLADGGQRVVSYNRDFSESADPAIASVPGELFDIPPWCERSTSIRCSGSTPPRRPTPSSRSSCRCAANVQATLSVLESARTSGVR
jgi:UDP-glucose 4-epimerase